MRRRHPIRLTALGIACAAAGAGALALTGDDSGAQAPTAAPNRTMSGKVSTCVRPVRGSLAALTLDGRRLPFRIRPGDGPRCRDGTLRILRIQPLLVGGEATFVRRGGCDRPARGTRCTPTPTAHVRARELEAVPVEEARRNGNGAPATGCTRRATLEPRAVGPELDRMRYKIARELPGRSLAGALWSNYGNPGRRFGRASTTYVLWNLPRTERGVLPGGGIVQAVLPQGHPVALCDAAALSLPSWDRRGKRNGRVRFVYAAATAGGQTIHGWVLRGYAYRDEPFTKTLLLDER